MKMKKIFYILVFELVLFLSGCSKISDFGDTNVNPATTSTPVTSALLTNVLANFGTAWYSYQLPSYYCQYFSETQYTDVSCYWTNQISPMSIFSGALYDLQNIIITNTNESTRAAAAAYGTNDDQIAIARILKAYIFWTLTDNWGDIPYKDALKGNPNVIYDNQEVIYKDLIKELTEAIAQFKSGSLVKGDIVYNGDVTKWKKLANSLRMLIALNLSKQYPGASDYAATEFKAALNDPAASISDNSENFELIYPGGSGWRNPFYDMFNGSKYNGESATMTSILIDTIGNDGRQAVFGADITGAFSTLGVPYGRARSYVDPWCQQHPAWCLIFAPAYRTQTSPFFLLNAASVLLARAEAADRGWTNENTGTLYKAGITASFTQWDLAAPDAGYFTKTKVALGAAGKNLKQIAIQQYLAYYPDGLHGWNTWRRTGWPVLYPAPDALNYPKVIPRRITYGSEDYSLNPLGVAEAIARLGANGDKMDSRVWWDKE
jgi:Starch-binding associating with outer membrane